MIQKRHAKPGLRGGAPTRDITIRNSVNVKAQSVRGYSSRSAITYEKIHVKKNDKTKTVNKQESKIPLRRPDICVTPVLATNSVKSEDGTEYQSKLKELRQELEKKLAKSARANENALIKECRRRKEQVGVTERPRRHQSVTKSSSEQLSKSTRRHKSISPSKRHFTNKPLNYASMDTLHRNTREIRTPQDGRGPKCSKSERTFSQASRSRRSCTSMTGKNSDCESTSEASLTSDNDQGPYDEQAPEPVSIVLSNEDYTKPGNSQISIRSLSRCSDCANVGSDKTRSSRLSKSRLARRSYGSIEETTYESYDDDRGDYESRSRRNVEESRRRRKEVDVKKNRKERYYTAPKQNWRTSDAENDERGDAFSSNEEERARKHKEMRKKLVINHASDYYSDDPNNSNDELPAISEERSHRRRPTDTQYIQYRKQKVKKTYEPDSFGERSQRKCHSENHLRRRECNQDIEDRHWRRRNKNIEDCYYTPPKATMSQHRNEHLHRKKASKRSIYVADDFNSVENSEYFTEYEQPEYSYYDAERSDDDFSTTMVHDISYERARRVRTSKKKQSSSDVSKSRRCDRRYLSDEDDDQFSDDPPYQPVKTRRNIAASSKKLTKCYNVDNPERNTKQTVEYYIERKRKPLNHTGEAILQRGRKKEYRIKEESSPEQNLYYDDEITVSRSVECTRDRNEIHSDYDESYNRNYSPPMEKNQCNNEKSTHLENNDVLERQPSAMRSNDSECYYEEIKEVDCSGVNENPSRKRSPHCMQKLEPIHERQSEDDTMHKSSNEVSNRVEETLNKSEEVGQNRENTQIHVNPADNSQNHNISSTSKCNSEPNNYYDERGGAWSIRDAPLSTKETIFRSTLSKLPCSLLSKIKDPAEYEIARQMKLAAVQAEKRRLYIRYKRLRILERLQQERKLASKLGFSNLEEIASLEQMSRMDDSMILPEGAECSSEECIRDFYGLPPLDSYKQHVEEQQYVKIQNRCNQNILVDPQPTDNTEIDRYNSADERSASHNNSSSVRNDSERQPCSSSKDDLNGTHVSSENVQCSQPKNSHMKTEFGYYTPESASHNNSSSVRNNSLRQPCSNSKEDLKETYIPLENVQHSQSDNSHMKTEYGYYTPESDDPNNEKNQNIPCSSQPDDHTNLDQTGEVSDVSTNDLNALEDEPVDCSSPTPLVKAEKSDSNEIDQYPRKEVNKSTEYKAVSPTGKQEPRQKVAETQLGSESDDIKMKLHLSTAVQDLSNHDNFPPNICPTANQLRQMIKFFVAQQLQNEIKKQKADAEGKAAKQVGEKKIHKQVKGTKSPMRNKHPPIQQNQPAQRKENGDYYLRNKPKQNTSCRSNQCDTVNSTYNDRSEEFLNEGVQTEEHNDTAKSYPKEEYDEVTESVIEKPMERISVQKPKHCSRTYQPQSSKLPKPKENVRKGRRKEVEYVRENEARDDYSYENIDQNESFQTSDTVEEEQSNNKEECFQPQSSKLPKPKETVRKGRRKEVEYVRENEARDDYSYDNIDQNESFQTSDTVEEEQNNNKEECSQPQSSKLSKPKENVRKGRRKEVEYVRENEARDEYSYENIDQNESFQTSDIVEEEQSSNKEECSQSQSSKLAKQKENVRKGRRKEVEYVRENEARDDYSYENIDQNESFQTSDIVEEEQINNKEECSQSQSSKLAKTKENVRKGRRKEVEYVRENEARDNYSYENIDQNESFQTSDIVEEEQSNNKDECSFKENSRPRQKLHSTIPQTRKKPQGHQQSKVERESYGDAQRPHDKVHRKKSVGVKEKCENILGKKPSLMRIHSSSVRKEVYVTEGSVPYYALYQESYDRPARQPEKTLPRNQIEERKERKSSVPQNGEASQYQYTHAPLSNRHNTQNYKTTNPAHLLPVQNIALCHEGAQQAYGDWIDRPAQPNSQPYFPPSSPPSRYDENQVGTFYTNAQLSPDMSKSPPLLRTHTTIPMTPINIPNFPNKTIICPSVPPSEPVIVYESDPSHTEDDSAYGQLSLNILCKKDKRCQVGEVIPGLSKSVLEDLEKKHGVKVVIKKHSVYTLENNALLTENVQNVYDHDAAKGSIEEDKRSDWSIIAPDVTSTSVQNPRVTSYERLAVPKEQRFKTGDQLVEFFKKSYPAHQMQKEISTSGTQNPRQLEQLRKQQKFEEEQRLRWEKEAELHKQQEEEYRQQQMKTFQEQLQRNWQYELLEREEQEFKERQKQYIERMKPPCKLEPLPIRPRVNNDPPPKPKPGNFSKALPPSGMELLMLNAKQAWDKKPRLKSKPRPKEDMIKKKEVSITRSSHSINKSRKPSKIKLNINKAELKKENKTNAS